MVVADILGVVKLVTPVPPARGDPPVAAAYQSMVSPTGTVADKVTVPDPHLEALTGAVGAAGAEVTVAVTAVRVTETQPPAVLLASA